MPQHQEKESRELPKKWLSPLKQNFWRFPSFLPSSLARNRLLRPAPFSSAQLRAGAPQLSCGALSLWFPACCSCLDELDSCGGKKKTLKSFCTGLLNFGRRGWHQRSRAPVPPKQNQQVPSWASTSTELISLHPEPPCKGWVVPVGRARGRDSPSAFAG